MKLLKWAKQGSNLRPKFREEAEAGVFKDEFSYYDFEIDGRNIKYEISDTALEGYTSFTLPSYLNAGLISKKTLRKHNRCLGYSMLL